MFITFSMAVMRMSGAIGFNPLFGKSNFPVKIRAYFKRNVKSIVILLTLYDLCCIISTVTKNIAP